MFKHSIQNYQQLSHASCDSHFRWFPSLSQPIIKYLYDRIEANGRDSTHVKYCPQVTSAAPDTTFAFKSAAISIQRSDPYQSRNLFTIKPPQFWKVGDNGSCQNRSDTGNTTQQFFFFPPNRTFSKRFLQVLIKGIKTLSQPCNMIVNTTGDHTRGLGQTVLFHSQHFDYLPTSFSYGTQLLDTVIGNRSNFRLYRFSKAGQNLSVNQVSLGKSSCCTGKVAYLTGIDYHHRDIHSSKYTGNRTLKASTGFQDNQGRIQALKLFSHSHKRLFDAITLGCGMDVDIQLGFRYINSDKTFNVSFHNSSYYPSLQDAGSLLEAPATVRADWICERDDPCS